MYTNEFLVVAYSENEGKGRSAGRVFRNLTISDGEAVIRASLAEEFKGKVPEAGVKAKITYKLRPYDTNLFLDVYDIEPVPAALPKAA